MNGQVAAYFDADAQYFAPPFNKSPDIVPHNINPGEFGVPASLTTVYGYDVVGCGAKSLADALNAELTTLETSGQWATILKDAGAPEGTLAAQIPPRRATGRELRLVRAPVGER